MRIRFLSNVLLTRTTSTTPERALSGRVAEVQADVGASLISRGLAVETTDPVNSNADVCPAVDLPAVLAFDAEHPEHVLRGRL